MAVPRTLKMNGQDVREQTLDEYLSKLDVEHCARVEVAEMRQTIKDSIEQLDTLEQAKTKTLRELEETKTALHLLGLQEKILRSAIKKYQQKKIEDETKVDEKTLPRPEGDSEHSL